LPSRALARGGCGAPGVGLQAAKMASLIWRLSARSASFGVLPSASFLS